MASLHFSSACFFLFFFPCSSVSVRPSRPERFVDAIRKINESTARRSAQDLSCRTGNPIDDCWRCDPNWSTNRQRLADCSIGFGRDAIGGKFGKIYVVTDPTDDDVIKPRPGTLRYGAIQREPLWIIFSNDMTIKLNQELLMNSYKTIDGRGATVHIAGGACITIRYVSNIIIHGLFIHDCTRTGNAYVADAPGHYEKRNISDGDGISIFGGRNIWVDHNTLYSCQDGLVDAIHGSTAITISNNHFSQHNKVMLLGHSDLYDDDKKMQVTVAYNHFGEGLGQRMPRGRLGYFHVVNNDYAQWKVYAIGGSAKSTIFSQGNRFFAPPSRFKKEVTKRENAPMSEWMTWNWRSEGDLFLNGAFFTPSGDASTQPYLRGSNPIARSSELVPMITAQAGALKCIEGSIC